MSSKHTSITFTPICSHLALSYKGYCFFWFLELIIFISYAFCSIFKLVPVLKQIACAHFFFLTASPSKTNVDSSEYGFIISICYARGKSFLGNTDQMHEKYIFDNVGGAGWWESSVCGTWEGGTSGGYYFFCADVALGSCSMACCFAFFPLLPLWQSPLVFLSPSAPLFSLMSSHHHPSLLVLLHTVDLY